MLESRFRVSQTPGYNVRGCETSTSRHKYRSDDATEKAILTIRVAGLCPCVTKMHARHQTSMNYRLLGRSGLRVSELSLGTMTFGEDLGLGCLQRRSQEDLRRLPRRRRQLYRYRQCLHPGDERRIFYWLHIWDQITPVEEVMRAFDDLVSQGKVLYVGSRTRRHGGLRRRIRSPPCAKLIEHEQNIARNARIAVDLGSELEQTK